MNPFSPCFIPSPPTEWTLFLWLEKCRDKNLQGLARHQRRGNDLLNSYRKIPRPPAPQGKIGEESPVKWHKTSFGEDYYLNQGSAIIISARVSPYHGNASQPKHEAWLWGAIIDNPGSLGVFDSLEAAKAEVEKRVKDSLEQIRKEVEA